MHPEQERSLLRSSDVRRRFDRAAARFDTADFVHTATRDGMLARLGPILIEAKTVVDLGCATGSACRSLARRFRRAHIIGIDLSLAMLQQQRQKRSWFVRTSALQADATRLPLPDQSIDVVFSNLLLPWIDDPVVLFREVARVLRKDGLLVFATLGPDSLLEIRHAWQAADAEPHVNFFPDMHDLGDAAVRAGLRDPVLDVDRLGVTYNDTASLFRDLTAAGARNSLRSRHRSLASKGRFAAMTTALESARTDGVISLDLELVYGHCWSAGQTESGGEYRIDANRISHRR